MKLQIEIEETDDQTAEGGIFVVVESDILPPVGARIHLNGRGIFTVTEHLWSVDPPEFMSEPEMMVHVVTRREPPAPADR